MPVILDARLKNIQYFEVLHAVLKSILWTTFKLKRDWTVKNIVRMLLMELLQNLHFVH